MKPISTSSKAINTPLALLLCAIFFIPVSAVRASQFRADNNPTVDIDEVVRDDLYMFGEDVEVRGDVLGELVTFSYSQITNGMIEGSANAFAYDFDMTGRIKGTLRLFAYNARINGPIDGNLLGIGQWIRIRNNTVIGKDINIKAERFDFDGTVQGSLQAEGNNIKISGNIMKDAEISAKSLIIVAPAVIKGDLTYTSATEAVIEEGVVIEGDTEWLKPKAKKSDIEEEFGGVSTALGVGFDIAFFVMAFITGIALLLLFKRHAVKASEAVLNRTWYTLAVGVLTFIILAGGTIIAMVLIVGIPLSILMIMLALILFYIGKIYTAVPLGRWVIGLVSKESKPGIILQLLVGLIILSILFNIPILGKLIYIAAFFMGAGAIVTAYIAMQKGDSPAEPPQ